MKDESSLISSFLLHPSSLRKMPLFPPEFWSELQRRTLEGYDEGLLRGVASRLLKPRSQWPPEELVRRAVEVADNPALIDRRLQDLAPPARRLLALVGHSRQPLWDLGHLVEMACALGAEDGLRPVFDLLEGGLLYPAGGSERTPEALPRLRSFEQWLGQAGTGGLRVFTLPALAARALGTELGLPDLVTLAPDAMPPVAVREADGLEWVLRLAVLWQVAAAAPLRRTQQGGFFKRDHERVTQPLLTEPGPDQLAELPDPGLLTCALADGLGIVAEQDSEVAAGRLPTEWEEGLAAALEALWRTLFRLHSWDPLNGWRGSEPIGAGPFPSACLLVFLLLARLPEGAWASPAALEAWLGEHHPYWANEDLPPSRQRPWVETFLLGLAYPLRLVQAARPEGQGWHVRLTALARWLLGVGDPPPAGPAFPQTLLVQPNLEIIAYRQGLTPSLVARLSRCAAWKTLGAACTLQLGPETVYRALESGETFDSIRLTLEQHGTRGIPSAVLDSLRTWADKRDRITVYPSATLLEFASADGLNEALARGLPGVRLTDTLAVVASDADIDFRLFRLTGTRDYSLPPEPCVTVADDGVTLDVDLSKADLLLETELPRFAERLSAGADGRRRYRLTPASLARAREEGMSPAGLEKWFTQRAVRPLPPAARLLLTGALSGGVRLQRHLILHVATPELADGLMQWPGTRSLIEARLGPTALVVAEEHVEALRERLGEAGMVVEE
jgi:hypothetical protein